jgi:hypothetical protein
LAHHTGKLHELSIFDNVFVFVPTACAHDKNTTHGTDHTNLLSIMATDDVRCFFDISIGGQHGTRPRSRAIYD